MGTGHVFVVQGLLEHLDCDALVVPSDPEFTIEPDWRAALRVDEGAELPARPERWAERGYGRGGAAGSPCPPTWFVDAVWRPGRPARVAAQDLAARLAGALREIAEAGLEPEHGRPHPLVAVPALGTGGGGFDAVRGALIDLLLQTCQDAVDGAPLDVAVVAKHPADYSAFQEIRRRRPAAGRDVSPELQDAAAELAARARQGELALFLGAGVGIAAGLPSWDGLLRRLERRTGVAADDLAPLDRGELLRRELGGSVGEAVVSELAGAGRYGLAHAALAALLCTETVTTNYDALYELAALDAFQRPVSVLPGAPVEPGGPWVLKMHGDVAHPESIVLSRSDVVAYDATARPVSSVVQALMLTRHLLVVGASMTDDNFLRLAHEVAGFQDRDARTHDGDGDALIGTVVTLSPKPAQERLWRGRFRYLATSDGGTGAERARELAIFLDLLAMLAASRDRYLLDPRYEQMLSEDERHVATAGRELADAVSRLPGDGATAWAGLRAQLRRLGADAGAGGRSTRG